MGTLAVDGYLNFDTKINLKGFNKGIANLNNSISSIKSQLTGLAASMGLAFGAKEAIEAAAEINAANSQLTQTFKELESVAKEAMQRVADSSGIVETRLRSVGTSIYAFAKTSGMDSAQALGMTEEALQVAADSAAYYDRSLEDTSETLKSFLKGNYANDAALGISCTETTRNAAANKLYAKSFSELSEAQKQLVLLQMVKDANALSGATGQAARESEGWENVLGNLKETWKQLLAVVGQPILSITVSSVQSLTSALAVLTLKAQIAVNTLSKLFGLELSQASGVTDEISNSVSEQNALTGAVGETAKAQKNSLAGFDKINKLSDSSGSASAGNSADITAVTVDTTAAVSETEKTVTEISEALSNMFEPLTQSWDDYGAPLTKSIQTTWESVLGLLGNVGDSFATVWTNGTGYKVTSDILLILTNTSDVIGRISDRFSTAWGDGTGTRIIQGISDLFVIILDTINKCSEASSDWAETLDFSPVLNSVSGLLESVKPLAEDVSDALSWFHDEVLLPIASWTIEEAVPASIDVLSSAIDVLSSAVDALKPLGKWLWDKFLKKIADWTGGKIVDFLEDLASALGEVSDWISEHKSEVEDLVIVVGALGAALKIASVITSFTAALATAGGVMGVLTSVTTALSTAFAFLTNPITLVCLAIAAIIAIGVLLVKHWDEVKAVAIGLWESIQETLWTFYDWVLEKFNALVDFFGDVKENIQELFNKIGEWFTKRFTEAWNGITKAFSDVKSWFSKRLEDIHNVFSSISTWFSEKFNAAWDNIKIAFSNVKTWFGERWNDIKGVFSNIGNWFSEKFTGAWSKIKEAFSSVKSWFEERWNDIKGVFGSVGTWFNSKFQLAYDKITGIFGGLGDFFSGVWTNISNGAKDGINWLLDKINSLIWRLEDGINGIINGINSALSISIPSDVPVIGGTSFALNMPNINLPSIPRLAQGTAIPANYGEFLAVLGDNKREPEVVSPLSTIERAVSNAMKKNGNSGGDIHIHLKVDEREIGRIAVKYSELERIRRGG